MYARKGTSNSDGTLFDADNGKILTLVTYSRTHGFRSLIPLGFSGELLFDLMLRCSINPLFGNCLGIARPLVRKMNYLLQEDESFG